MASKTHCTRFQFEQIAKGLSSAKVVIVCVSKEYANSDNCRMEFQFALKVSQRVCIVLCCIYIAVL